MAGSVYSVEQVRRIINALDSHSTEDILWVQQAEGGTVLGHSLRWDPKKMKVIHTDSEELGITSGNIFFP